MKYILIIPLMGLFSFFSKKDKKSDSLKSELNTNQSISMSYDEQIKVFESLGYQFNEEVTKEIILRDVYEMTWKDDTEKHIEENPFSVLYYIYGWRNPEIKKYNYSENCIWFDLDYFDNHAQYKWFMERMGKISNGEIKFENIKPITDSENWEWIEFKVNGILKKWKLEKTGYVADHFIQRFSNLPKELKTNGKYTYYDNGSSAFVIDFATDKEQKEFNIKTGLKREWLGEGNHFSEPKE